MQISHELRDRVCVITGDTRGLGLSIATLAARQGAAVVVWSRSPKAVEQTVANLQREGLRVSGLACNVGELAQCQSLAQHALEHFGGLDAWVNNAGLGAPYGPTADIPSAQFHAVVHTNILGTYNGSLVALRAFRAKGRARLINLYGRGDSGPVALQNAYAASKAWVRETHQGAGGGAKKTTPSMCSVSIPVWSTRTCSVIPKRSRATTPNWGPCPPCSSSGATSLSSLRRAS